MNEKEILTAFLAATLNLPTERIAETLYKKSDDGTITEDIQENALDALKALDKERVSKLKPDTKLFFDNGYKKAQAEVSADWEKKIREKSGVDADITGEELLTVAFEKVSKSPKLDDDKVKTHPLFLALEKKAIEDLKAAKAEGQTALDTFKKEQETTTRRAMAQSKAKDILLGMKPVLEDDQKIADRRIKYFLQEFAGLDYEVMEDGSLVPIRDGKRLENEHAHPVDFETLVKNIAGESFKFQVQDPKGNGGNANPPGQAQPRNVTAPKTKADFETAYFAETDPEKRRELAKAFEAAQRPAT